MAWLIVFVVIALIAFTARLAAAEPNTDDMLVDDTSRAGLTEAASFDPAWSDAGAAEAREAARQRAATGIGRIDLTITWRRTIRVSDMRGTPAEPGAAHSMPGIASATDPVTTSRGVLWVLLTWSR